MIKKKNPKWRTEDESEEAEKRTRANVSLWMMRPWQFLFQAKLMAGRTPRVKSTHEHQPFPPPSNKLIIPLLMFLWVMALRFSYSWLFFFFPPQTVLHHNCTAWYFSFSLFSTVEIKQDWLLWIGKCLERPLRRVYGSSENVFFWLQQFNLFKYFSFTHIQIMEKGDSWHHNQVWLHGIGCSFSWFNKKCGTVSPEGVFISCLTSPSNQQFIKPEIKPNLSPCLHLCSRVETAGFITCPMNNLDH